jgi:tetratricopeptide (TPR) repeat protein
MPGAPVTVFISYARRDSNFVDRLEAGLKASNFDTWVDRRAVEISPPWKKVLQDVIDRCDTVLIILSPASVASPYVLMEYKYALNREKHIILLEYQTCSDIPYAQPGIQKVDFRPTSRGRMRHLLFALNGVEIEPPSRSQQPTDIEQAALQSTTDTSPVVTQPVPVSTKPDLETIYNLGVVAGERGNFDLATALWQEILIRDPHFHNGSLADEYRKVLNQLRSYHVDYFRDLALLMQNARKWREAAGFWQNLLAENPQDGQARRSLGQCLRAQGGQASASGEWEQAISMWETLLKLKPGDAQATRQLELAKSNLYYAQYYKDAQQFIADDALSPARTQLRQLWQNAPYYGDPKALSLKVGMPAHIDSPDTLEKEEKEKLLREQREREGQEKRELDQQVLAKQQKEEWGAQTRKQQAQEPEEKKAQDTRLPRVPLSVIPEMAVRQGKEAQEARQQAIKRTPAWFIQNDLRTTRFVVWCSLFFLLSGLGIAIGILTQSRFWAISTITITMLLAYTLGYHRAIHRLPERLRDRVNANISNAQVKEEGQGLLLFYSIVFLCIFVVSCIIALFFVNSVSLLAYNSPQVGSILWFTRSWWLVRQVMAGLLIGATLSIIAFYLSQAEGVTVALGKAFLWGAVWGIFCWLIVALLALIFNWGFGFGNGWGFSLLGLVIGVIAGTGISSSFFICKKGKPFFKFPRYSGV